ncbi:2',3'-cyclic-nucleotide 3'-phosphodiesterase [Cynara cardunculus var. scolymus]|uniref:2',3'-cyclic-nucleotide 3'-phosphodiesterase n=1 Tax=Cynara cardunculus var. scolymus TaxID=59895 RepID=A0A103XEW7_CYNCS|nr:2',3'-cyclic-nucleotide 3'-phosphodiesterase [Cynara cardunculus var. scolymus]
MDVQVSEAAQPPKKDVYSVWALPPEDVTARVKKLMVGLRSEFGGPEFEPHVTVVGAISLTEDEARDKLKKACEGLKAYNVTVEKVATGTFFYQCVFLLLHPTTEANALDGSVKSLSFPITRLALYKTDTEDKTLKSWQKVTEITLQPNYGVTATDFSA